MVTYSWHLQAQQGAVSAAACMQGRLVHWPNAAQRRLHPCDLLVSSKEVHDVSTEVGMQTVMYCGVPYTAVFPCPPMKLNLADISAMVSQDSVHCFHFSMPGGLQSQAKIQPTTMYTHTQLTTFGAVKASSSPATRSYDCSAL